MKRSIVAALLAALTITAAIGVSVAAGSDHQAQTSAGKRGKTGKRGPRGFSGPAGPAGIASVTRVTASPTYQGGYGSGAEVQSSTATCPAGSYVTGGGFRSGSIDNIVSYQISSATQYSVVAVNEYNGSSSIAAHAICAAGSGLSAASASSTKTPAAVAAKTVELQSQLDAHRK